MRRLGKSKILAFAGIVLLALLVAFGVTVWRNSRVPDEVPFTLQAFTGTDARNLNGRVGVVNDWDWPRMAAVRIEYPTNPAPVLAQTGAIEVKVGDAWVPARIFGEAERLATDSHTRDVYVLVPPEWEKMRVTIRHWRGSAVLPLGIGNFEARNRATSGACKVAQRVVKVISIGLYDRLWPVPPNGASIVWKTNIFELMPVRSSVSTNAVNGAAP